MASAVLEMNFHFTVDNATVIGLNKQFDVPDVDIECGNTTCYIDYELQLKAREWGLKSISVIVNKVTASLERKLGREEIKEEEKE